MKKLCCEIVLLEVIFLLLAAASYAFVIFHLPRI